MSDQPDYNRILHNPEMCAEAPCSPGCPTVMTQHENDLRERLASALADAADDGCFHPQGDPEMWDANEEDRSYWLRLSDSLLPVVHAFTTEQSEPLRAALARVERPHYACEHGHRWWGEASDLPSQDGEPVCPICAVQRVEELLRPDTPYLLAEHVAHVQSALRAALAPTPQQDGDERP